MDTPSYSYLLQKWNCKRDQRHRIEPFVAAVWRFPAVEPLTLAVWWLVAYSWLADLIDHHRPDLCAPVSQVNSKLWQKLPDFRSNKLFSIFDLA